MKRIFSLILSALIILFLASSCANDSSNDEVFTPTLDKEYTCNIKIVGDYSNFEALEAEFDKFNEYYPNVELSYIKLDDYKNNLSTTLNGNEKPNIFFSYTWMIGDEKYKSVVSHMENFSNSTLKSNLDCIRPGLINHDENGNVLMVPVFSRTYGMLVNNDLFNKEKIDVPSTWDELIDACNKLKENGHKSPMMGYSLTSSSSLMNTIAYPLFVSVLANNEEALNLANSLDSRAGGYMRGALEKVDSLIRNGFIDLDSCDEIEDNYEKVLLRFFEGDVPMMICTGDTVSGTKKREEKSEAFTKSPFNYSFSPIPLTNEGGYFIDSPSIEFSVNKNCDNLDMTNEFMKFLISNNELNEMAKIKRLTTPTKKMSFDSLYAPFAKISSDRIFYPEALGIKDQLTVQTRIASFKVGRGELTVSEAVSMYGSFA